MASEKYMPVQYVQFTHLDVSGLAGTPHLDFGPCEFFMKECVQKLAKGGVHALNHLSRRFELYQQIQK